MSLKIPKSWFVLRVGCIGFARAGLRYDNVKKSSPSNGYDKTVWRRKWWRVWWREQ